MLAFWNDRDRIVLFLSCFQKPATFRLKSNQRNMMRSLYENILICVCVYVCLFIHTTCDKNSEVICVLFILITVVSKVVDPMVGLSIISTCSSSTYSPLIVYPSLSLYCSSTYIRMCSM